VIHGAGFLIASSLVVQAAALGATIPPDVKKAVTFIFPADSRGNLVRDPKSGIPMPYGTGFFVFVSNDPPKAGGYGYLVTAKHVLRSPTGQDFSKVYLRLNKLKGDAEFVPLDLAQAGRSVVFAHPDPTVDIAVVPAFPSESVFDFKMIPAEFLTGKSVSEIGVSEGTEVFFTGLFTSYLGEHRNNPIVRFGRVAMLPEDRITWQETGQAAQLVELYLLETQSYGGNSGSPVFFYFGADRNPGSIIVGPPVLKLAGIMRGSFNENRAIGFVQPDAAPPIPVSSQNIGIAAVTPAHLLYEILFSDGLKKFRSDHPVPLPGK
jgi:hypothetical protein